MAGLGLVALGVGPAGAGENGAVAATKAPPDAGERNDPENVTAISLFMETVGKGNEKYAVKDYAGAVDAFKMAIKLNPRHPLGSYLLGEVYLATGSMGEAEAALKAAEELSDPTLPLVRSHVLFALADLYERQSKWEQARLAWQTYTAHATKLDAADAGALAHPQSAAARLKAIDDGFKLDKQYEIVRRRIAAERADAGSSAPERPAGKKT